MNAVLRKGRDKQNHAGADESATSPFCRLTKCSGYFGAEVIILKPEHVSSLPVATFSSEKPPATQLASVHIIEG